MRYRRAFERAREDMIEKLSSTAQRLHRHSGQAAEKVVDKSAQAVRKAAEETQKAVRKTTQTIVGETEATTRSVHSAVKNAADQADLAAAQAQKAAKQASKIAAESVQSVAQTVSDQIRPPKQEEDVPIRPSETEIPVHEASLSNKDKRKLAAAAEKNRRSERKRTRKDIDKRIKAERARLKRQRPPVGSTLSDSLDNLLSLLRFNITFKMTMNNLLVMLLLVLFFAYVLVASLTLVRFAESEAEYAKAVTRLSKTADSMKDIRSDELRNLTRVSGLEYAVTDQQGNYLYATRIISPEEAPTYNASYFIRLTTPAYMKWSNPVKLDGKPCELTFYRAYTPHDAYYAAFYQILLGFGTIFIIVYVIWINGVTKRTLWPIKSMTYTVEEISIQSLNKRIDTTSTKDELKDLAVTFNRMMDNIQESYEKQKQFVSDASHELRTPIAIIQGYVGMLERWGKNDPDILNESIEAIRDESHNMQSLVEKMLFIARSEKGKIEYEMGMVDLDTIMTDIASEFRMIDPAHQFVTDLGYCCELKGNRDALIQLFRIFIDNSIKYTPEGGTITLRSKKNDGWCVVEIEDTGMGIDKEDLPKIFDRFFRADKSRTKQDEKGKSFGLGLSIARIILDGHGARIVPESEPGVGTKMSIFFKL